MGICDEILEKSYAIFCDNFFTSVQLATDLLEHGTTLVGTTRPNRKKFPKEVVNKGAVDGCDSGMTVSSVVDNKVHCFIWLDNQPIFFCKHFVWCNPFHYSF